MRHQQSGRSQFRQGRQGRNSNQYQTNGASFRDESSMNWNDRDDRDNAEPRFSRTQNSEGAYDANRFTENDEAGRYDGHPSQREAYRSRGSQGLRDSSGLNQTQQRDYGQSQGGYESSRSDEYSRNQQSYGNDNLNYRGQDSAYNSRSTFGTSEDRSNNFVGQSYDTDDSSNSNRYSAGGYDSGFGTGYSRTQPSISSQADRSSQYRSQGNSLYGSQSSQYGSQDYGTSSHRGKGPKGYRRSDDRIKEEVCDALEQDHHIDASDIDVQVKEGIVTLSGFVDGRQQKRLAEDCISHLRGVKDVTNNLQVQAQSESSSSTSKNSSTTFNSTGRTDSTTTPGANSYSTDEDSRSSSSSKSSKKMM